MLWVVIDTGVRQRSSAIDFYIKDKLGVEGKTLDELAKKNEGASGHVIQDGFNLERSGHQQKDAEFGRTTGMDHGLTTGPYYAFKIAPGIHYTMGGVKDQHQDEVPGQRSNNQSQHYTQPVKSPAANGDNRIGGNSVADIVIFGRRAGTQAAAYVKAQQ